MLGTVELPLWLVIAVGILAAFAAVDRLLVPSARWFFRRRTNRVISELNRRLDLEIPPLVQTQRRLLVDRLCSDPSVLRAVDRVCEREGMPRDVAMDKVRRYAGEVAPAFKPFVYFRLASWIGRLCIERIYRVRLIERRGGGAKTPLAGIPPDASVVLVMNHRSNVDYILVTYLVIERAALSYAVGEWARVWPLRQLIRALGAYFVRRDSGNALYRRVLERYVQLAVEGGVTQAIFPEGGLSRDGALRAPRLGLIDYMVRGFDPQGKRDIVFVPVAINYDRVLEDRTLLRDTDAKAERRSGTQALKVAAGALLRAVRKRVSGNLYRFGYASASFGEPFSLREHAQATGWRPIGQPRAERIEAVRVLTDILMRRVGEQMPVLPVSLVSHLLLRAPTQWHSHASLAAQAQATVERLAGSSSPVYLPRDSVEYFVETGLRMLTLRRLVDAETEPSDATARYRVRSAERGLLAYYALALEARPEFGHQAPPPANVETQATETFDAG